MSKLTDYEMNRIRSELKRQYRSGDKMSQAFNNDVIKIVMDALTIYNEKQEDKQEN